MNNSIEIAVTFPGKIIITDVEDRSLEITLNANEFNESWHVGLSRRDTEDLINFLIGAQAGIGEY